MRDRMARVRIWLVVGTSLLVLLVAGFLGYARYRSRAFLAGLPGKLGAEITRETNGYTYSQTVEGRTIFTLHAAKMEQRKDGVVRLHDVGVVLYGRKQDRADRIYGSEFEYDQAAGVVRALGVVHLDLLASAPVEGGGKKQRPVKVMEGELGAGDPKVIHVLTSGLVYLTKLGVAATKEDLEFSEGSLSGRAHGAEYSSDTGIVVMQSAVEVHGLAGGGPMVLRASRAEFDQVDLVASLTNAKVVTTAETVEASHAVVHVRRDGSPEKIEGWGAVRIARAAGGVVTAERAEAVLNAAGKAEDLRLWDGVRYVGEDAMRRTLGRAGEARVVFDKAGQAERVTANGNAEMEERETTAAGANARVLTARVVDLALVGGAVAGRREVEHAEASGNARLIVTDESGKGKGPLRTEMTGDLLKAQFVGGRRIASVVGIGHTSLHRVNAAGVEETAGGDRTDLVFRAAGGGGERGKTGPGRLPGAVGNKVGTDSDRAGGGVEELTSAVQTGHVSMERKTTRKQGGVVVPVIETTTADRAVYDGETDRVTLTGGVVLMNPESTLWAAKVSVQRATGDATAEGEVRVSYVRAGQEREPMHVVANRAELRGGDADERSGGGAHRAIFFGGAGRLARMWQGTTQIEAPTIEMEEGARRLTASGAPGGMQVHTVLVGSGGGAFGKGRGAGPSVVRVSSRDMVYADGAREVVFSGGVVVEDAQGTMKAQRATVYLQQAKAGSGASAKESRGGAELFSGGNVERIVAMGKVEIDQPGRRGVGEQLVYTAADGMFVLTGTAVTPPRVEDEAKGTVTGGAMRFHAGDDSVEVTSGGIQSGGTGQRRRTETRVKQ